MRSSETISLLAGALAKAQIELTNPPKSVTAAIEKGGGRGERQTYRYAPLSAGLDIIRKALGQHELAVLQTTDADPASGTMVLTTTLAHSSGEWVSTTWPVCRLLDISDPKLIGAALTYARRYSLFALVGIAGEDDLDAPDLTGGDAYRRVADGESVRTAQRVTMHSPGKQARAETMMPLVRVRGRVTGQTQAQAPSPLPGDTAPPLGASHLGGSVSDLLGSLEAVENEAALLRWTSNALPVRNGLDDAERRQIDQAFVMRAEAIGVDPELRCVFRPSLADGPELLCSPLPTPAPEGGHDAQATL